MSKHVQVLRRDRFIVSKIPCADLAKEWTVYHKKGFSNVDVSLTPRCWPENSVARLSKWAIFSVYLSDIPWLLPHDIKRFQLFTITSVWSKLVMNEGGYWAIMKVFNCLVAINLPLPNHLSWPQRRHTLHEHRSTRRRITGNKQFVNLPFVL